MKTGVFIHTPSLPLPNIIGLDGLVKGVIFEDKTTTLYTFLNPDYESFQ
jgi:hypothetical protein